MYVYVSGKRGNENMEIYGDKKLTLLSKTIVKLILSSLGIQGTPRLLFSRRGISRFPLPRRGLYKRRSEGRGE